MYSCVFINKEDLTSEQELILINRIPEQYRLHIKAHQVRQYSIDLATSTPYYFENNCVTETDRWIRAKTFEEFEQLILDYSLTH